MTAPVKMGMKVTQQLAALTLMSVLLHHHPVEPILTAPTMMEGMTAPVKMGMKVTQQLAAVTLMNVLQVLQHVMQRLPAQMLMDPFCVTVLMATLEMDSFVKVRM